MQRKLFVLLLSFLFICQWANGQRNVDIEGLEDDKRRGSSVVDDTTKQIYGPKTTSFTYERNIKYNNAQSWKIDTSLFDFHKYQFIAQKNNTYQNLGNIGTPMQSIYPEAPDVIGARLGIDIYDIYYGDAQKMKIYDTKSPYSKFKIIWGGQGRSLTEAEYTRNIDERSNVSFEYKGLFIDKQIEKERRGDRNALGTYYNFGGNYSTKDKKYFILGNFTRNYQKVNDYGGILIEEDSSFAAFFKENRQGNLSEVQTKELRTNYHIYQQYKFNNLIQIYHSHDRYKQFNDFTNATNSSGLETDSAYFGQVAMDSIPIIDRSKIIYRQHELGIKGDIGKTFYSFYYRGREVNMDYKYIEEDSLKYGTYYMENYAGFQLRFGNDSTSFIETYGEYLSGENYKIGARIQNKWFFAEGKSARYLPTYTQRTYLSRHDTWSNNFESTINTKITSGLKIPLGKLTVSPQASYNLITDYIYYTKLNLSDNTVRPYQPLQASGDVSIINGQVNMMYSFWRHFMFKAEVIYSEVAGSSSSAVNLPKFLLNGQIAYSNIFYEGNLQLQFGVDYHQRSAYFANAYDPSIMQYYVQNDFEVPSFPVVDVFLNIKINRGKAFLKMNNIYEVIKGTGYFVTPYYPAQTTILDFGIDWALYD